MGARPQHDFARTLLSRDAPSDRERARNLLELAVASYCELGLETHAAAAAALVEEGGIQVTWEPQN